MRVRWAHDGVRLEAPARHRNRWWAAALLFDALAVTGTGWLLSAAWTPTAIDPFRGCETDPRRPGCEALRPGWMSWDHTRESWRAARMCALTAEGEGWGDMTRDHRAVAFMRPTEGLQHDGNQAFLAMVARQDGSCDTVGHGAYDGYPPYDRMLDDPSWRTERPDQFRQAAAAHADREFDRLVLLEDVILGERAVRAREAAQARHQVAVRRAEGLQATAIAWVPALVLAWIALLVGLGRVVRLGYPVRIEVTSDGVRVDDVWVPRDRIAWIAVDGQRLRVQPWTGDAVFSRPLPLEAIEVLDELDAIGDLADDVPDRPVPDALRDLTRRSGARRREGDD